MGHHWPVVAGVAPVVLGSLQPAAVHDVSREEDIVQAAAGHTPCVLCVMGGLLLKWVGGQPCVLQACHQVCRP